MDLSQTSNGCHFLVGIAEHDGRVLVVIYRHCFSMLSKV